MLPDDPPLAQVGQDVAPGESDLDVRSVTVLALGLLVAVPVVLLGIWLLFGSSAGRQVDGGLEEPARPPAAAAIPARLESAPHVSLAQELSAMRQAEESVLNSYGWVDRENAIVRIPIDRAMDLVAERDRASRPGADVP